MRIVKRSVLFNVKCRTIENYDLFRVSESLHWLVNTGKGKERNSKRFIVRFAVCVSDWPTTSVHEGHRDTEATFKCNQCRRLAKKVAGTQDASSAITVPNQTSGVAPIPMPSFINAFRIEMSEWRRPTKRSYCNTNNAVTEEGVH